MTNTDSPQQLEQVREWYLSLRKSLELYRSEIYKNIHQRNVNVPIEFVGMTESELKEKFDEYFRELSFSVCLNLAAAIEANIQNNFKLRVTNRKKDNISKKLRELVRLEKTYQLNLQKILNIWKENKPELKKIINQYETILQFRHWLAHGRHWILKTNIFEEDLIYQHGLLLLSKIESE